MFIPFVVLGLSSAFLVKGLWPRAILTELRRPVWWAQGVLLAGYAALYLLRRDTAGADALTGPNMDVVPGLVRRLLGETFPTGVVGGPLRWGGLTSTGGLADPVQALVVVAWAAIGLLALLTCLYRRRAWRAWAVLAAYVVAADVVPTVLARATQWDLVGAETRYVADAPLVFALCVALAALPVEGEDGAYRTVVTKPLSTVTGLLTAGFLAASLISINTYGDTLTGERVRTYLDNVRASLAQVSPDADIYSRPVPEHVVLPWNGARRLTSYVLAPLADTAVRNACATRDHRRSPTSSTRPDDWCRSGRWPRSSTR